MDDDSGVRIRRKRPSAVQREREVHCLRGPLLQCACSVPPSHASITIYASMCVCASRWDPNDIGPRQLVWIWQGIQVNGRQRSPTSFHSLLSLHLSCPAANGVIAILRNALLVSSRNPVERGRKEERMKDESNRRRERGG